MGCPYCLIEFERVWGVRVVSSTAASNNKVEVDPNGIKPGEPGAKLDSGKVDVGIIFEAFPRALYAVAQVANFGASKYSRGVGGLSRTGSSDMTLPSVDTSLSDTRVKLWTPK